MIPTRRGYSQFTSLLTGYSDDEFRGLSRDEKMVVLKSALKRGLSSKIRNSSEKHLRAGHYFNNGLFHIVALAEISLNDLFKTRQHINPPKDYWWLSDWYMKEFGNSLSHIQNARTQVNWMKHHPRSKTRQAYSMKDGLLAFGELLSLLEVLATMCPRCVHRAR